MKKCKLLGAMALTAALLAALPTVAQAHPRKIAKKVVKHTAKPSLHVAKNSVKKSMSRPAKFIPAGKQDIVANAQARERLFEAKVPFVVPNAEEKIAKLPTTAAKERKEQLTHLYQQTKAETNGRLLDEEDLRYSYGLLYEKAPEEKHKGLLVAMEDVIDGKDIFNDTDFLEKSVELAMPNAVKFWFKTGTNYDAVKLLNLALTRQASEEVIQVILEEIKYDTNIIRQALEEVLLATYNRYAGLNTEDPRRTVNVTRLFSPKLEMIDNLMRETGLEADPYLWGLRVQTEQALWNEESWD